MANRLTPPDDASRSMALAVVESCAAPTLLLDGAYRVIAASTSFCRSFEIDPATVAGQEIFTLGGGEWGAPQLRALLRLTADGDAAIDAYEMDLKRPGQESRRLVTAVHKLIYDDALATRLLVTITDITDARAADRIRRALVQQLVEKEAERAVLQGELQHRVANSLQIIASVLLQTARRVQSDETKEHLNDAHHRVMSVAAMQRMLATSAVDDVALRPYIEALCDSLGASMIYDQSLVTIAVHVDDSVVAADRSVSLGLIVTELVINTLKHAFPGDRGGKVTVTYRAEGDGWALSVGDDGVGMDAGTGPAKTGLGTSIVLALAKQLQAHVETHDSQPGTLVCVVHAPETAA